MLFEVEVVDRTAKLRQRMRTSHRRKGSNRNGLFELSPDAVILTDEDFHVCGSTRVQQATLRVHSRKVREVASRLIVPEEFAPLRLSQKPGTYFGEKS